MTSLTTSGNGIEAQPPSARRRTHRRARNLCRGSLGTIDRAGWRQRLERAFSSPYIAGPHVALYRLLVGKDQNLDQL